MENQFYSRGNLRFRRQFPCLLLPPREVVVKQNDDVLDAGLVSDFTTRSKACSDNQIVDSAGYTVPAAYPQDLLAKHHFQRRPAKQDRDEHHGRDIPSTALVMAGSCLPHAIQFTSQNGPTMDTSGEEKQRAAKRDVEANRREGPQEQRTDPGDGPQRSSRQSQMEVPCRRLMHQTAQRGLNE